MRTCIANVAIGTGFVRGQDRLEKSINNQGHTKGLLFYRNTYPPGSPAHGAVPYAFKTYALEEAQRQGYDLVLWCDASIYFVRPPSVVFETIGKQGYYFSLAGFGVGQWCTDLALENFQITRDEAMKIPLLVGGFYGINLRSEIGLAFMDWMGKRARDRSLVGAWDNTKHQVSLDPRVLGHRHDQPAISVFVSRHSLKPDTHPGFFAYQVKGQPVNPKVVGLCQGV